MYGAARTPQQPIAPQGAFTPFGGGGGGFGSGGGGGFGAAGGGGQGLGFGGAASGGGFGAPATASRGGLFGNLASPIGAPQGAGGGGFGSMTPGLGGAGGFGSPGLGQQQGGGFGAAPAFGSPPGGIGGGFGAPTNTMFGGGAQGAGGFGQPQQQQQQGWGAAQQPKLGGGDSRSHNPAQDVELRPEDRPTDTISAVRFNQSTMGPRLFAISSWDNTVKVFEAPPVNSGVVPGTPGVSPVLKGSITADQPVLDCCFNTEGNTVFGCSGSGAVFMWNLGAQATATPIGRHDRTAKCMSWIPEKNLLATGGWDGQLKYWDLRQQQPALQVTMPDRIVALHARDPLVIVAIAPRVPQNAPMVPGSPPAATDQGVYLYNLQQPQQPFRWHDSQKDPLFKYGVRAVAISTDRSFYTVGGVEGRLSVQVLDPNRGPKDSFAFRCHRNPDNKQFNSINGISFHPSNNTFSTCGSDGIYTFWDKDLRQKYKAMTRPTMFADGRVAPITSQSFDASGSTYAYSVGYDWHHGAAANNPAQQVNTVMLYNVQQKDITSKPGGAIQPSYLGTRR